MSREDKGNSQQMGEYLILVGFGLSGMAALIYEVVWIRPLSVVFGSSVYAVSTMLTAFMAGFALGSFGFRHLADKVKNPVYLFCALELGIGLYGLMIVPLFSQLPSLYSWLYGALSQPLFTYVQFIVSFLFLIIPTTLMGATWPVVNKVYIRQMKRFGEGAGKLYSTNSLGSVLGSFSAGFLLIPLLGVRGTSLVAASLNLAVAAVIFIWVRGKR